MDSFRRFKQAPYQSVGPSSDRAALTAALRDCHACSGVFILATHYHGFDRQLKTGESVRAVVHELIDLARELRAVEFPAYEDLW